MAEYKENTNFKNTAGVFSDEARHYADAECGEFYGKKMEEMELSNRRKEAFYVYPSVKIK